MLQAHPDATLEQICTRTGMKMDDVLYTLQDNQLLDVFHNGTDTARLPPEYFAVDTKLPASPAAENADPLPNDYRLRVPDDKITAYLAQHDAKPYVRVQPDKLRWTPFLLQRPMGQSTIGESATAPSTIDAEATAHATHEDGISRTEDGDDIRT